MAQKDPITANDIKNLIKTQTLNVAEDYQNGKTTATKCIKDFYTYVKTSGQGVYSTYKCDFPCYLGECFKGSRAGIDCTYTTDENKCYERNWLLGYKNIIYKSGFIHEKCGFSNDKAYCTMALPE